MDIFKQLKDRCSDLLDAWFADAWEKGDLFGAEQNRDTIFVESFNPHALCIDVTDSSND